MAKLLPACTLYRLMLPLMLCLILSSGAKAILGQKDPTVTFSFKDVKLTQVFKEIKKQTGYTLMYANQKVALDLDERVSVNFVKSTISSVMDYLLKGKNLQWQIQDESILILPKKNEATSKKGNGDSSIVTINVSGKVVDAEGKAIAGATVVVRGTNEGTSTDTDGNFRLPRVKKNSRLLISSIGFEPREVTVTLNSIIVNLNMTVSALDETVIIAYGSTTKRYNTGNVTTIKSSEIEKQVISNPLQALQGRVPGLFITQNTSVAGGSFSVRIQGQNSLSSGNDPLYVIDGIPVNAQLPGTGLDASLGISPSPVTGSTAAAGNPLNYLNPGDIEQIDILKDADATAIYGSRAANGAILITTKKGKAGATKIEFNIQKGWGQVARKLQMLNTSEYLAMRHEAFRNDGVLTIANNQYDLKLWDTTRYTDWQETLIGNTSQYSNASLGLSGGTSLMQFRIAGTYQKQTTVYPISNDFADQKGSMSFNFNIGSKNQKLKLQFTGNYMLDNNKSLPVDLTRMAVQFEPNAPRLFNDDGSLNWEQTASGVSTFRNPLANIYSPYINKTTNLISNLTTKYKLTNDIELAASLGYNTLQTEDRSPRPFMSIQPELRSVRSSLFGDRNITSVIVEPQIRYRKNVNKGRLDVLLGATYLVNNSKSKSISALGYNNDDQLSTMSGSSSLTLLSNYSAEYKYNAGFVRLGYNWDEKYLLSLNGRRDGSSRFGNANRFHNFASVGVAWILTNEIFIPKNSLLSFAKLRATFGSTGNDQIADYQFISRFTPSLGGVDAYQGISTLQARDLSNAYLQWEKTNKLQVGFDIGLIHDKVLLNGSYSRNRSSNQLIGYKVPGFTGFGQVTKNFPATIQNTSWEFSVISTNVAVKKFNWSSSLNITIPKNKVISFPDIKNSSYANIIVIGQPVDVQRLFQFSGVNPNTGDYEFTTSHGDKSNSPSYPDDANVFVSSFPKFYGGLGNSIGYRGIQLDFLFQFVKQMGKNIYFNNGGNRAPGEFLSGASNQPSSVSERWQEPGDVSSIQAFHSKSSPWRFYMVSANGSDAGYSDASFIRLKNASLSYPLPQAWMNALRISSSKLYVQGQNLLTFTKYKGLDPENQTVTQLPPQRIFVIGVQAAL